MHAKRPFHLMAKPIGPICNIRCDYCFYLAKEELFPGRTTRAQFTMREDVLESFIRQYIDAQPPGTSEVTFAWQGGEPTLLPRAFYDKALELQRRYARPGMTIRNSLQTNGTLVSRSRARYFAEHDFLIGISIDGPADLHDKFRRNQAGQGTHREVMAGFENLKEAGVEFNTLTVVQSDNGDHPERVYDFLKSIGSTYMQFIPIVERLPDGGVNERSVRPEQWGSFMTGIFDRWSRSDIGRIFVQHFDMLLGIWAGYPSSLCVHSKTCGNALAIEHDGSVYSCDHFVTPQDYQGNVTTDDLAAVVESERQVAFGRAKHATLPQECRECPWLQLCWGGCPKDRLLDGEGGRLNWLCEGYRALYEHTAPHFVAMREALRRQVPVTEYRTFFPIPDPPPARNERCPCGSGLKFKQCHGRDRRSRPA